MIIGGLGLVGVLFWILLVVAGKIQSKVAPELIHPYTGKPNEDVTYSLIRMGICLGMGIVLLFWSPYIGLFLLAASVIFGLQFWMMKKTKETIVLQLDYSPEEKEQWEQLFTTFKSIKQKSKPSSKVVITDQNIYFSKTKRKSLQKKAMDNIKFEKAEMETPFLKITYSYSGFTIEKWFVYIPKSYEQQVTKLLEKINKNMVE